MPLDPRPRRSDADAGLTRLWATVPFGLAPATALAAEPVMTSLAHVWLVCFYATLAAHAASRLNPWFGLLVSVPPGIYLLRPLLLLHDPALRSALGAEIDIASGLAYYAAVGIYAIGVCACLMTTPLRWWPCRREGGEP